MVSGRFTSTAVPFAGSMSGWGRSRSHWTPRTSAGTRQGARTSRATGWRSVSPLNASLDRRVTAGLCIRSNEGDHTRPKTPASISRSK